MLARVESAKSMRGPLLYNTQKVAQNQALFIDAHNFLQDKDELTLRTALKIFRRLTELNERPEEKAIHFSLNFADSDHLDDRQLIRIADDFMRGIDFGDQPWLLYKHIDAGHPHVHIVTTNIRPDGSRILNDLRAPNRLMKLCHQIEEKHQLTPAMPGPDLVAIDKKPLVKKDQVGEQMATYGRLPTSTQLRNILRYVNRSFSFTSFQAYNAVLSLYRIRADRGRPDSPMYRSGGLYYRMIDQEGKKIGAPIKASKFAEPVTLKKLEQTFAVNQEMRRSWQESGKDPLRRLSTRIDMTLFGKPAHDYSLSSFAQDLLRQQIHVVIPALQQRPTRNGKTERSDIQSIAADDGHGLFYVDMDAKAVIRDTELGAAYTGTAILQRTGVEQELRRLYLENKLEFPKSANRQALEPGYPDCAETRLLLFRLSPQHNGIVDRQIEAQQQQQRQSPGLGHSL
jgi:Relaxase/Mobilisation nuclease domain